MDRSQPSQQPSNFASMIPFNMNPVHYMQQPMGVLNDMTSQANQYGMGLKKTVGGLMLDTTQRLADTGFSLMDGAVNVVTTLPRKLFQGTVGSIASLFHLPTPRSTYNGYNKNWNRYSKSFGNNDGQPQMQPTPAQPPQDSRQQPYVYGQPNNVYDQSQSTVNNQRERNPQGRSSQSMEYMPDMPNAVNPPQKIVRYGSIPGFAAPSA